MFRRIAIRVNGLRSAITLAVVLSAFSSDATVRTSTNAAAHSSTNDCRSDRILVKPRSGTASSAAATRLHELAGGRVARRYPAIGDLQVITLQSNATVSRALQMYRDSGLVEYAEPDYFVYAAAVPNDPYYIDAQWGFYNWGQLGGKPDADIDAAEGWELAFDARPVLVSVIDSGIRVTHQDLAANLWINTGEIPGNGIDDDANGYVDDVNGINAINNTGDLTDGASHGTHVAGTLGGVGNNGVGVVGVAWRVQMMGCKFLDAQFQGSVSDAIECINYSRIRGAKVINASWGGRTSTPFYSAALYDAINSLRQAGIIFVAAAGNFALNNDSPDAFYPASFDLDNIISVAATTRDDLIAEFSDYGANTVDLGAPGYIVLSCWATADNAYDYDNGTSMAAPHVAAACALAWKRFPNDNYQQIIQRVLAGTDPLPDLAGKCRTGGRLNLRKVLEGTATAPPTQPVIVVLGYSSGQFQFRIFGPPFAMLELQTSTNMKVWIPATTNQIPASGNLTYADNQTGLPTKFYRAVIRQ